jgi:hypothetical protein
MPHWGNAILSSIGLHILAVLGCTLPSCGGLQIRQTLSSLIRPIHLLNLLETHRGHEAFAVPGSRDLSVQLIHGFEGETLGFVDHRPHECGADDAEAAPYEEDTGVEVCGLVDHIGSYDGDDGVEQPLSTLV